MNLEYLFKDVGFLRMIKKVLTLCSPCLYLRCLFALLPTNWPCLETCFLEAYCVTARKKY